MLPQALTQAIEVGLKEAGPKPFAVFDFDNTCIVNDIAEATLAYLCDRELLHDRSLLGEKAEGTDYHEQVFLTYHALLKEGKIDAAYKLNARMFSGFTPGEAEAVTLAAIIEEGSRIGSKMVFGLHVERGLARRPIVLSLMQYLRERGVRVWIMSASPELCVRAAMKHFGIEGELIGVRSKLKGSVFTQELEEPRPIIEGKVACMRKYIDADRAPLLVADDSTTGLPLLETAEVKVVVDRENELAALARERGWFLL
ncbi:haloacid dehalogenase-like hydrolase [Candidatus Kaiserbacteria bacterium]|nr:haloacid dehalogenase-like hydrolase [Candidatus Kaiserbacteria bacterium]